MDASIRAVLITAPDAAVAEALARGLVEARLAACVNVLPGVVSYYRWEGRLEQDQELLLIAKTRESRLPALMEWVRVHHPAKVPEIIALPVIAGDAPYLAWVASST